MACTCGTVRLIGDVHGDASALRELRGAHPNAIQIGDLGYGFKYDGANNRRLNDVLVAKGGMRFFRGNHDNPQRCRRHKKHLSSGWHKEGFFVVGGDLSINWMHLTPSVSWWEDEQHSAGELRILRAAFETAKPRLMLSHEAPPVATDRLSTPAWKFESSTAQALQEMWEAWQPSLWVFGHWHRSRETRIGNTLFVCVGEKDSIDVHLPSCPEFATSCMTQVERLGARLASREMKEAR